jgi:hypothetical protein
MRFSIKFLYTCIITVLLTETHLNLLQMGLMILQYDRQQDYKSYGQSSRPPPQLVTLFYTLIFLFLSIKCDPAHKLVP